MNKEELSKHIQRWMNHLINILFILLFVALPLWFDQTGFRKIGDAKWNFYSHIVIPYLILLLVIWLIDLFVADNEDTLKMKKTDRYVLIYLVAVILSSLFADDKTDILNGFDGWYTGLKTEISFALIYFLTSRYWKKNRIVVLLSTLTAVCVFALVVLNRFWICPSILLSDLGNIALLNFVSTIGNIDWVACYMAVMIPVLAMMYQTTEQKTSRIFYGIAYWISVLSVVTLGADSAYLVLLATLFILCYQAGNSRKAYFRFLEILIITLTGFVAVGILYLWIPNHALLGKISDFCMYHPSIYILLILFLVLYVYSKKQSHVTNKIMHWIHSYLIKLSLLAIAAYVVYSLLNTFGFLPESLQTSISYFVWSDNWGNYRGNLLHLSLTGFIKMSMHKPIQFLVGAGPDQLWNMLKTYVPEGIAARVSTDAIQNAHNEAVNTLCNYGVIGLIGYMGIFISVFKTFFKKENNAVIVIAGAVLFVSFIHGMVSFQQAVSTPLVFAMFGIFVCGENADC